MLYGKYDFHCEFRAEASLPLYKGSVFRGVFGLALKKTVCALKMQDCKDCMLKKRCLYARIFESVEPEVLADSRTFHSPPRPFVIEPPLTKKEHFPAGSPFDFSLLLFGEVNHSLPYFIYAFGETGKSGIGRRINGRRGTFFLKSVSVQNRTIFSDADKKLDMEKAFSDITVEKADRTDEVFRVRVFFLTPLRFRHENRLMRDLPFHVFTRIMLRRTNFLFRCRGAGLPEIDYAGLLKRAEDVRMRKSSLRWFDWQRYSKRQEKKMMMGGIIGDVVYEGRLSEYLPLLGFCEKVHLGKQTAFGLGKIAVNVI